MPNVSTSIGGLVADHVWYELLEGAPPTSAHHRLDICRWRRTFHCLDRGSADARSCRRQLAVVVDLLRPDPWRHRLWHPTYGSFRPRRSRLEQYVRVKGLRTTNQD